MSSAKIALEAIPQTKLKTVKPQRPSWAIYDQSVRNEQGKKLRPGVYYHSSEIAPRENHERELILTDDWISTPISVTARTICTDNGSEGRLLRVQTHSGEREWVLPMEAFGGSGEDVRRVLFSMGAVISLSKRREFMEYLLDQQPATTLATTSYPGWHESGCFVLPNQVIGDGNVRFQSSGWTPSLYTAKGSFQRWTEDVAARSLGNPTMTLAVGCALAGPLLSLVGVNGGGIHCVGDSSTGKTLLQWVAASVWGNPETFAASWDASKGGLETEASSRNDTLLVLDEIKRADPRRVQEMAYMLANGQGKATMTREREARTKLYWRLLTLSSGERSLSEHAAISGNSAHAGAELRMIDVNAGTRRFRAFDELHGMDGHAFHRSLTIAISANYGHLGPKFVEQLIANDARTGILGDFSSIRAHFADDSAQAGRVADRFAVVALAGELAIEYQLLPWPKGSALSDCKLLFCEWLERAGSGNAEDRQILSSITDFIDRHGSSRFSELTASEPDTRTLNRAGYWTQDQGKKLYLFNKSGLLEAAHGFGLPRIIRALDAAEALAKRDSDRKRHTKKYRLPGGGSAGLYVIDTEKLEA